MGIDGTGGRDDFCAPADGLPASSAESEAESLVSHSQELFEEGLALCAARLDTGWSLTDCISFAVMRKHGLTKGLTGERHFEQTGFKASLV